ncbi:DUF1304 domain-containing protein [Nocardioides sp. R-C-SC26]|uniref:DUF1304 domain-containing protein n=1 Tax=Nocardioides sp. R-C-SC26 TaxID=2870414 RepID=UPI001E444E5A|nr:DUF1304 domain-containing protein [Nocardioides sp. R-C-SC26]
METVALVIAALAALLHVFIFYLESLAWTGPRARAVFGTSTDEAEVTRSLAFNQGFYNLFLAVLVGLGIALVAADEQVAGRTLVFAGAGSMAAAALVLLLSSPAHRGAAIKQGLLPAVALVLLAVAVA